MKSLQGLLSTSLRWRVVAWTSAVVFLALLAVIVLTRSFYLGQVVDNANSAVVQEVEEFNKFSVEALDPDTGQPFDSSQRLIETYLSRQIPDEEESMLGFVDKRMLQMDYSQMSGQHPAPIDFDDLIVHEILNSPSNTGIFHGVHWARVTVNEGDAFAVLFDSSQDRAQVSANMGWIALISLGGLAAAIAMAWLVSGQIIAPVQRLQRVASTINNSDLTQRVPVETDDEIGELARTFNAMLDRLEIAYRDQRQFVDDAGHELRTPITVVRGQLELLPFSTEEEKQRSIELSMAELDRMARMVNDMLTLAVADSGDFVKPTPVDVAELTISIDDKASTLDSRARLVEVAEGTVLLDEDRVTEAILELFGNALKYSDSDVELGSTMIGEGDDRIVRFWVRDRGNGIPADKQETLFGRFARGEQHAARPGGAGLGLSIVRAIGEAHGGRAFVESTVGLGSIFGLEIPAPDTIDADKEQTP